jgi:iron complex outermembrane receptor protein
LPGYFQIAPQALDQALVAFSLQSGLQVIADGQLTNGRISPGVTDQLSPLQALEKLLKGSGLIFQLNSESSVILEKQEENALSDTSILPTITITGKAIQPSYEQSVYNSTHTTTANKRDTPLLETPVNIQVITKPLLDDQQAITIDKSLTTISGLTTGAGSATNSDDIYIRGFRTPAYYRNGFLYDTEFDSWGKRQMANIERIDVVKGSASLLYGRMEPGGMVNIITKRPLDKAYYAFQQQFGSNDFYRTTIDATGPIPDRQDWLYRVNLSYENSSSYRELVENERLFLAPVLQWQISPDTQVTLELEYRHDHLTNDFMEWPYQKGRFIDIPRSRNLMEATPVELDDIFIGLNWSHQINPNWLISHQFATEHREMPKAISMYSKADDLIDGSLLARLMANTQSRNHSYFNTLNLTGQIDLWGLNHQLLFGGEFYRLESKRTFFYHAPAEPIDVYHPQHTGYTLPDHFSQFDVFDSTTHHYGVYFQDQIKLPFGFQVLGGIRYQAVDMEDTVSNYWSFFEDAIASRAGLLWQVQPWLSLYGNYGGIQWSGCRRQTHYATNRATIGRRAKNRIYGGPHQSNCGLF